MALAFDTHGSGPPLVLLHGTGSHRGMWDPVVGALARERRVIAVDLPGFARLRRTSTADPTPRASRRYLERWFAEQGLDRPHVAGNSLGGGIALELARRRRRRLGHRRVPHRLLDPARARLRAALAARVACDRRSACAQRCRR